MTDYRAKANRAPAIAAMEPACICAAAPEALAEAPPAVPEAVEEAVGDPDWEEDDDDEPVSVAFLGATTSLYALQVALGASGQFSAIQMAWSAGPWLGTTGVGAAHL